MPTLFLFLLLGRCNDLLCNVRGHDLVAGELHFERALACRHAAQLCRIAKQLRLGHVRRDHLHSAYGFHPENSAALVIQIAVDVVHAGPNDLCVMVRSREAALAMTDNKFVPVDLALIGIVDELSVRDDGEFDLTLKKGTTRYS